MAWTSLFTPQHGAASARRRVGALLAGCAALALLAGCATAPREPVTVRVIAFNDFHGNLESGSLSLPWPDPDQPGRAKRLNAGGAAFLANTVQALRQGARHSVVLHSGDMIGGTPLVSALFRHESTIDIANRLGVDIAIPGNHEFDAGKDELLRVLRGVGGERIGVRHHPRDRMAADEQRDDVGEAGQGAPAEAGRHRRDRRGLSHGRARRP